VWIVCMHLMRSPYDACLNSEPHRLRASHDWRLASPRRLLRRAKSLGLLHAANCEALRVQRWCRFNVRYVGCKNSTASVCGTSGVRIDMEVGIASGWVQRMNAAESSEVSARCWAQDERSPDNSLPAAHVLLGAGACISHPLSKDVPGGGEARIEDSTGLSSRLIFACFHSCRGRATSNAHVRRNGSSFVRL
jgi:hypothetical protein